MVNMVGWHHKEPEYNADHYGEPRWFINHRAKPTDEHPQRAIIYTPVAHAVFRNGSHARLFTEHPGDIAVMAHYYLELVGEGQSHSYVFPNPPQQEAA